MHSTMMHTPMTVQVIMQYGARVFPNSTIGIFDGEVVQHSTYAEVATDASRLANALKSLGVASGDRVGTFSWNNRAHMKAYLAIPSMGAIMHTVNIRLATEEIAYVINHAEDKVIILDASLRDIFAPVVPLLKTVEHVVVFGDADELPGIDTSDYATEVAGQTDSFDWPEIDETAAAAVCYTSGTTGHPKGVVYSHRTTFLHSIASRATDTFGICERDRVLLLPPMFHANAWGFPYAGWMSGSDFVLPGPHVQLEGLKKMIASEAPTMTAMVPTVLGDLLSAGEDAGLDMSSFRMIVCGGSAVPEVMIETARTRWGVSVLQGWGMTETSPMCALSHPPRAPEPEGELYWRTKSGRPVPGVQVRVVDDTGDELPHDGQSVGELQLKGTWITGSYYRDESPDSFTEDGWLRTGDIGHIDERYYTHLTDRTKDVIKSGGEWISSVDLENELLAHPKVAEAAVVATPDERWQERPLAVIVPNEHSLTAQELQEFLRDRVAKFWIPEYWSFVSEIPLTSVGKIDKKSLRLAREKGELAVDYVR
ncbi:MAG: long-chain fatty acid--CoA ligase [Pseudomonadota bacterium]